MLIKIFKIRLINTKFHPCGIVSRLNPGAKKYFKVFERRNLRIFSLKSPRKLFQHQSSELRLF